MNKGSDILSLLEKIVPPNDFQHRNGFNNRPLIDRLSVNEREILNQELIEKLSNKVDFLIVETLGYMGSNDALPILYKCLNEARLPIEKIIIAASIFEIKKDKDLIAVCIHEFQQIQDPNTLVASFYYLVRFDDYSTNKLIEHYSNDENYLVSYNAKRAISLGKSEYR